MLLAAYRTLLLAQCAAGNHHIIDFPGPQFSRSADRTLTSRCPARSALLARAELRQAAPARPARAVPGAGRQCRGVCGAAARAAARRRGAGCRQPATGRRAAARRCKGGVQRLGAGARALRGPPPAAGRLLAAQRLPAKRMRAAQQYAAESQRPVCPGLGLDSLDSNAPRALRCTRRQAIVLQRWGRDVLRCTRSRRRGARSGLR